MKTSQAALKKRRHHATSVKNGAVPDGKKHPDVEARPSVGFNGEEIRRRLRAYDRTPFLDLLGIMLECAPTEAAIRKLAENAPERYVMALGQLARTAGYTDKTEATYNVNLNVTQMSDSQLEDKARSIAAKLQLPAPFVDVEFEELPVGSSEQPAGLSEQAIGASK